MEAGPAFDPSKIENIFQDFKGRRAGLIKALTTDVEEFFRQCDPDETWSVDLLTAEVPPEIPEPVLGINFERDRMSKKEWLTFVAAHSDSWLYSVAFYYLSLVDRSSAGRTYRARLFSMINDLPTVSEALLESFEQDDDVMCLICYRDYSYRGERWIVCDVCHKWFHFGCVDITEEIAEKTMEYKCPFCSTQQLQL